MLQKKFGSFLTLLDKKTQTKEDINLSAKISESASRTNGIVTEYCRPGMSCGQCNKARNKLSCQGGMFSVHICNTYSQAD